MEPRYSTGSPKVKTTVLFEKSLLEEIDEFNPFKTRKDFLDQACKNLSERVKAKNYRSKTSQSMF